MKRFLLVIAIGLIYFNSFSQNTCSFQQYCTGASYNFPAPTGNDSVIGPNYGCLTSAHNPTFFYFHVGTPGTFSFTVSGMSGGNVDAICWGPYYSVPNSCNSINTGTSGSIADCSYSTASTDSITVSNALAGQYYIIGVTNPSNISQTIHLNQIGGTGSTLCDSTKYCPGSIVNAPSICFVTTDNNPTNEIFFNHPGGNLKGTVIFRMNSLSTWDSIGFVPIGQPDEFTDLTALPNQQAYSYCIAYMDSCNNVYGKSPVHKTILLQTSLGTSGQINLSWNAYVGVTVSAYKIYRGPSPTNLTFLNQVSNSTLAYTDLSPLPGTNYYKIAFTAPSCTSNATHDTLVTSNFRADGTTGLNYLSTQEFFNVYPNPAQKNVNIYSAEIAKRIELTNLLGETIVTITPKNNLETINIENFPKGVYLIKITTAKGYVCKKIMIE